MHQPSHRAMGQHAHPRPPTPTHAHPRRGCPMRALSHAAGRSLEHTSPAANAPPKAPTHCPCISQAIEPWGSGWCVGPLAWRVERPRPLRQARGPTPSFTDRQQHGQWRSVAIGSAKSGCADLEFVGDRPLGLCWRSVQSAGDWYNLLAIGRICWRSATG